MRRAKIVLSQVHAIRTAREGDIDTVVDDYLCAIAMSTIDSMDGCVIKLGGGCELVAELDE